MSAENVVISVPDAIVLPVAALEWMVLAPFLSYILFGAAISVVFVHYSDKWEFWETLATTFLWPFLVIEGTLLYHGDIPEDSRTWNADPEEDDEVSDP